MFFEYLPFWQLLLLKNVTVSPSMDTDQVLGAALKAFSIEVMHVNEQIMLCSASKICLEYRFAALVSFYLLNVTVLL